MDQRIPPGGDTFSPNSAWPAAFNVENQPVLMLVFHQLNSLYPVISLNV